jgi:hypothetical protein
VDVGGVGKSDLLTGAGTGGGPHLTVLDPTTLAAVDSFIAFDPSFTRGTIVGGR